jgi:mRNA-degrading endonuclease RelE of RelBE toxin-antitoxin system
MRLTVKPSARKELMGLPDEVLLKAFRTILELREDPRPRGYDKVEGKVNVFRVWVDRLHRVLYEIDATSDRVRIISVGPKGKSTYR